MGRHTADSSSDREPREHLDRTVSGERRAALNRTRTAENSVLPANPQIAVGSVPTAPVVAPKSVAANRVSDTERAQASAVRAVPATPADPRIVKQRRARAVATAKPTAPRSMNASARKRATIPALS